MKRKGNFSYQEELERIKKSNENWAKRDYKKTMKEAAKKRRKINPWALNGVAEQMPIKGMKRFKVMRG